MPTRFSSKPPSVPPGVGAPAPGDLVLAGGLLVVAVLSGLYLDAAGPGTVAPDSWWQWGLIVVPPLAVAVRRLNPAAAVIVATTAQVFIWTGDLPEVLLPIIIVLYTAAAEGGRTGTRVAVAAGVVLSAVTAVGLWLAPDVSIYQLPLVVLTCGAAIALGSNSARQRSREAELASEVTATRLRAEQERRQAIDDERATIGRELHDIIGHTLATIAVRAEAADRVGANRPDAPGQAVTDIAVLARSSLDETRRVLAGLRQSNTAELTPPPGMEALRALVADLRERMASTGTTVTLTEQGCDEHEPSAVVLSGAYRIVQESLTNAVKYGRPGAVIEVVVDCGPSSLDIVVDNEHDSATLLDRPGPGTGAGTGIEGMAERANVLGGTFTTERTDSSFTVRASLPSTQIRDHS